MKNYNELEDRLSNVIQPLDSRYADISDDELPSPPAKTIPRLPANYAADSSLPTNGDSQETIPTSPLTSLPDIDNNNTLDALEQEPPLARQDDDTICALCQDTVDEDEQVEFWKFRSSRTIRDQMLFCKEHKRSKALKEYKAEGYPDIDWSGFPSRIRSHKEELVELLRNETVEESSYRRKHAESLLSGKAAVLRTKKRTRKAQDLEKGEQELDNLETEGSSTGYYGPRGKRIMMEVITKDLSDTIREVAAKDPVVGRSGFAMFLQAVLLPELTIMLVMEDKEVGRGVAEEIIRESAGLGTLLHEEVEDDVRVGSEDEDEDY